MNQFFVCFRNLCPICDASIKEDRAHIIDAHPVMYAKLNQLDDDSTKDCDRCSKGMILLLSATMALLEAFKVDPQPPTFNCSSKKIK